MEKGAEANKNLNPKKQFYDVFTRAMSMLTCKLQHKPKTSEKPQPQNVVLRRVLMTEHCFDPQCTTFSANEKIEVFAGAKTSNKMRISHASEVQGICFKFWRDAHRAIRNISLSLCKCNWFSALPSTVSRNKSGSGRESNDKDYFAKSVL